MSDFRGEPDLDDPAQLAHACGELSELCSQFAQPGTIGRSGPADSAFFFGRLSRTLAAAAVRIGTMPPASGLAADSTSGSENPESAGDDTDDQPPPSEGGEAVVPKRGPGRPRKNPQPAEAT